MNWILAKILLENDLETWSKLKAQFFSSPYNKIYSVILKFYDKHGKLPSFADLEVSVRDKRTLSSIRALKQVEIPDIDNDIAYEALINEYAQNRTLDKLDDFVENIVFKDAVNIVDDLNKIALQVEEETDSDEQVMLMSDYMTVDHQEMHARVPLGLSNDFDTFSMGAALSEMFMFGGFRGSGKSIVCSNIVCNQFQLENTSLYFSIEMRGREIYERNLGILSGVPPKKIRSGNLSLEEKIQIAKVRADMTKDGAEDLLTKFEETQDFQKFEEELVTRPLADHRLITIDNPSLSLIQIDATIAKYKNAYKDKLTVVVVDYINQIAEKDGYDWKTQIEIAKRLKEMARKHEIIMVTPFQTDEDGGVRFSKGILIPPDWAWNMKSQKTDKGESRDSISFECQKARNDGFFDFESEIDWSTLKISPTINYFSIAKAQEGKKPEKIGDDL